jgi:hypothetical protein
MFEYNLTSRDKERVRRFRTEFLQSTPRCVVGFILNAEAVARVLAGGAKVGPILRSRARLAMREVNHLLNRIS